MDQNNINNNINNNNGGLPQYTDQQGQDPFAYIPQNNAGAQNTGYQPQGGYQQQNGYQQYNGYQPQGGYQQYNGYQQQGQYNTGAYDNGMNQQMYNQPEPTPGISIASMVFGILSLILFCCLNKWDLIVCIPAIVLGIIGLNKEPNGKGYAIAGIITGAVALLLTVIFIISMIVLASRLKALGSAGLSQLMQELIKEAMQNN